MRELKFRAWRYDKVMSNPFRLFDNDEYYLLNGDQMNVEDSIIMQCTGLKDKNGKEIYEGDITAWHYGGNWVVEWHTGESRVGEVDDEWGDTVGFYLSNHKTNPENGYRNYEPMTSDRIYNIIGNIYENPELMEAE